MFDFCNAEHIWKGMLGLATHWAVLNNHTFDQYAEGLTETKRIIDAAGETWVGDSLIDAGNVRLISLTALMNPVADATALDIGSSYRHVIDQLTNNPSDKLTVVLVHSGKEYVALGSDTYNQYLRSFVDAGADVVVAAHTHVIGDMEIYKDKPIFRGIGNFIFDQFDEVATQTAMAVRLRKENGKVLFETLRTRE
jgi:poly-gamma-glutamate synthesis protein (capsule biosynthesis protein)